MRQKRVWRSGIPDNGMLIGTCGVNAFFGTLIHQTLTILDTDIGKATRRRIGSAYGAVRVNADRVLLLSGREGKIWEIDNTYVTLKLLATVDEFSHWSYSPTARAIFLSLGPKLTFTDHSAEFHRHGPDIARFDLNSRSVTGRWSAGEKLNDFSFLARGEFGYLAAEKSIGLVRVQKNRLEDVRLIRLPLGWEVRRLLPEAGIGLAVSKETLDNAWLAAFELPSVEGIP
jgi:hypothetical protein